MSIDQAQSLGICQFCVPALATDAVPDRYALPPDCPIDPASLPSICDVCAQLRMAAMVSLIRQPRLYQPALRLFIQIIQVYKRGEVCHADFGRLANGTLPIFRDGRIVHENIPMSDRQRRRSVAWLARHGWIDVRSDGFMVPILDVYVTTEHLDAYCENLVEHHSRLYRLN